jgi:hypothetical protein
MEVAKTILEQKANMKKSNPTELSNTYKQLLTTVIIERFSKTLNRLVSNDEIFEINNYVITKSYTDCSPNDTTIKHTLKIKFKLNFDDLNSIGEVFYMEELENNHWNTKARGFLKEEDFFFKTVGANILFMLV